LDRVSVLIPTYNRSAFVHRAVTSALSQKYSDIEVVVYDDGSTDDTKKRLRGLRIKYIDGKANNGEPYSRNALIDAATGKYCCWLDSDDVMNVWRVSSLVSAIEVTGKAWVCSGTDKLERNDVRWKFPPRTSWTMHHSMPSVLFEKRSATQYDLRYRRCACDMRWELDMIAANGQSSYVPLQLYYLDHSPKDRMSDQDHNPRYSAEYAKCKALLATDREAFYRRFRDAGISPYPDIVSPEQFAKIIAKPYAEIKNYPIGYVSVAKAWG
jgi:glycosyltransferase involved in cell wall biosynthesis